MTKEVYIVTIYGEVDDLVLDDDKMLWVDKTGDLDVCFNNKPGDVPDESQYPWIKVCYTMRDFSKTLEILKWVKWNVKSSLSWID